MSLYLDRLERNLYKLVDIKTIKDARMWKRKGLDMTPEHVYYQQYTDDLKIYENIFPLNESLSTFFIYLYSSVYKCLPLFNFKYSLLAFFAYIVS